MCDNQSIVVSSHCIAQIYCDMILTASTCSIPRKSYWPLVLYRPRHVDYSCFSHVVRFMTWYPASVQKMSVVIFIFADHKYPLIQLHLTGIFCMTLTLLIYITRPIYSILSSRLFLTAISEIYHLSAYSITRSLAKHTAHNCPKGRRSIQGFFLVIHYQNAYRLPSRGPVWL